MLRSGGETPLGTEGLSSRNGAEALVVTRRDTDTKSRGSDLQLRSRCHCRVPQRRDTIVTRAAVGHLCVTTQQHSPHTRQRTTPHPRTASTSTSPKCRKCPQLRTRTHTQSSPCSVGSARLGSSRRLQGPRSRVSRQDVVFLRRGTCLSAAHAAPQGVLCGNTSPSLTCVCHTRSVTKQRARIYQQVV